jgi:hypothetical protein
MATMLPIPGKNMKWINLEKAVETANHANHAKTQRIKAEARFTQREKALIRSTLPSLAYLAYFAVETARFRINGKEKLFSFSISAGIMVRYDND